MANAFYDFLSAGMSSGIGSILGTIVKMLRRPPKAIVRGLVEVLVRITVGTCVGALAQEWFHFGPWTANSIAACGAMLADEIIRGIEANGKRIRNVQPPLPFEKE